MPDYFNMPSIFDLPVPQRRVQQPMPQLPPPTQEETESLLSRIRAGAVHSLGYIGGSLSKATGGRAIRGLLGGRPEELLSLIPFSDTLGITNPAHEVRGSDLLGGDENTSFFSPQGLGGFGLDVALDPATYLGPGLIAKGYGAVARGVGKAATKLPLVGGQIGSLGEMAGNLGSRVYNRTLAPLFESAVMDKVEPGAQSIARNITARTPQVVANVRHEVLPMVEAAERGGFHTQQGASLVRQMAEGAVPVSAEAQPIVGAGRAGLSGRLQKLQDLGFADQALTPQLLKSGPSAGQPMEMWPRQAVLEPPKTWGEALAPKKIAPAEGLIREDRYRGLTAGRIGELAAEDMSQLNPLQKATHMMGTYLDPGHKGFNEMTQARITIRNMEEGFASGRLTPDKAAMDKVGQLQKILKDREAEWLTNRNIADELIALKEAGKLPQFANHPLFDLTAKYLRDDLRAMHAEEMFHGISEMAQPGAGASTTSLADTLRSLKMTVPTTTAQGIVEEGAPTLLWDKLVKSGKVAAGTDNTLGTLGGLHIPTAEANSLHSFVRSQSLPGTQDFMGLVDSITNLTKNAQTVLWPANHMRNQLTALWQNVRVGAKDPTAAPGMNYLKPWLDANAIHQGQVIEGLAAKVPMFKGMTDAEATKAFNQLAYEWDVAGRGKLLHTADVPIQERAAEQLKGLVGSPGKGVGEAVKGYAGGFSPWQQEGMQIEGVLGATKTTLAPVRGGRELATTLDTVNRKSTFLAALENGKTPAEAAADVIRAHYDFGALTSFEKTYLRRLVPFYSWAKGNIPSMVKDLIQNPGGVTGQTVRVLNEMAPRQQGFVPDYLGSGMTVPIGERSPEGQQTFLASMGLPVEDLANLTRPGNFLGMVNPLLKAPLELIANRNFFTGRELTGTAPHTGSRAGDELLAASPLGRFATTYRHLTDPRMSMGEALFNLASPGRLSNVDVGTAARQQLRQQAEEMLMANPAVRQFSRVYVRPEDMQNLSSTERALLGLYQRAQQGR